MAKATNVAKRKAMLPSREDVHRILGELDDSKATAILALKPSIAELEQAALWAAGAGEPLGAEGHPLAGVVGQIVEILAPEEENEAAAAR
jgi:hypothetical protein